MLKTYIELYTCTSIYTMKINKSINDSWNHNLFLRIFIAKINLKKYIDSWEYPWLWSLHLVLFLKDKQNNGLKNIKNELSFQIPRVWYLWELVHWPLVCRMNDDGCSRGISVGGLCRGVRIFSDVKLYLPQPRHTAHSSQKNLQL